MAVTRADLVGQYIGCTAPKTEEVLKKAMGVLFIDEAYYLYRPENERDYGQEAIEILLQVMENQREGGIRARPGVHRLMDECERGHVLLAVATTTSAGNQQALFASLFEDAAWVVDDLETPAPMTLSRLRNQVSAKIASS